VAAGGASDGYAGVWVSRDGSSWRKTFSSVVAGWIDLVVLPGGQLFGYWGNTAWVTSDPTVWAASHAMSVPEDLQLASVASGPGSDWMAIGDSRSSPDRHTLLISHDAGANWIVSDDLPIAPGATARWLEGEKRWVVAGRSAIPGHLQAWVTGEPTSWDALPTSLIPGTGGILTLVASIHGTIVLFGSATELEQFYIYAANAP
jgi:hypothetical protein